MKNIFYFVGWLLKRMFGGVIAQYYKYDEYVTDEPGIAVFPTIMLGILVFMFVSGIAIFTGNVNREGLWVTLGSTILWFANYFRILMREQYRKFMQEQDKFLNTLKGQ
jgi:hypothetical protein